MTIEVELKNYLMFMTANLVLQPYPAKSQSIDILTWKYRASLSLWWALTFLNLWHTSSMMGNISFMTATIEMSLKQHSNNKSNNNTKCW